MNTISSFAQSSTSGVIQALADRMDFLLKDFDSDDFEITLVPVEGKCYDLAVDLLLVVTRNKIDKEVRPASNLVYHALIVADAMRSGIELSSFFVHEGVDVMIRRVAGDANDVIMAEKLAEVIAARFPDVPTNQIFEAEAQVIPRNYPYQDFDSVRKTLLNACMIASTRLLELSGELENHALVLKDSSPLVKVTATLQTHQPQITNAVGAPVRADIELRMLERDRNSSSIHADLNREVLAVRGFTDFYPPAYETNSTLQSRFVITDISTCNGAPSIYMQLLAFALIPVLPDKRVNYLDTRRTSFVSDVSALLGNTATSHDLIVSMDVEECGPSTYWQSVFEAAAAGNEGAIEMIVKAADRMTSGLFSTMRPEGAQMFAGQPERIHLGHYVDEKGDKRDIRDVDYLAMLGGIDTANAEAVQEFIKAYKGKPKTKIWGTDLEYDEGIHSGWIKLENRWKLIQATTSKCSDVTLTGYARRVTFDTVGFLLPLVMAIRKTGFTIGLEN